VVFELRSWEFPLVIAPHVVIGGTGSPVNPTAILCRARPDGHRGADSAAPELVRSTGLVPRHQIRQDQIRPRP